MAGRFPSSGPSGSIVTQDREDRFFAARLGQRFSLCHQAPGTGITGQTAFLATTPTFLLYRAAAASRLVLSGLTLAQMGTVAGGVIKVAIAIDSADRYSAAGTLLAAQNMNAGSSGVAETLARLNPTASAAGAGTRYVFELELPATLGTITSLTFKDGIIAPATGSIAVYTWAAATGPTWTFALEFTEDLT